MEENEWDDGRGDLTGGAETVLITDRNDQSPAVWNDAQSIMTATAKASTLQDAEESGGPGTPRSKGTSGWTKVKPREKD